MVAKPTKASDVRKYKPLIPMQEPLVLSYKPVSVVVCRSCGRVLTQKRWTTATVESVIEERAKKAIVFNPKTSGEIVDCTVGEETALVVVQDDQSQYHEEYEIPYTKIEQLCSHCSKNNELYFEGVLQLRAVTPAIITYAQEFIASLHKKNVYANKTTVHDKTSMDIRISNQRYIKNIAKALVQKFGGSIQNDAKLFSYNKQTSRNIYRVNVTYTAFPFKADQIIYNQSDYYRVKLVGMVATIQHLDTHEKLQIDALEARKYSLAPKYKATICAHEPHLSVLHPISFQQIPVIDAPKLPANKQTIEIFLVGERAFFAG